MGKVSSVLFVCTGNSCRSVMAEGLLKKGMAAKGRPDFKVASCGVAAFYGAPPTEKAVRVMKAEGVDVAGHRAQRLTEDLIKNSDLILVMEEPHKNEVVNLVPEAAGKTHLLKGYAGNPGSEGDKFIPDPIGGSIEVYETVLKMIKDAVLKLVEKL